MILSQQEITQSLMELKAIWEQRGIRIWGIFGSYARNQARETSDVDVLIETTDQFVKNTDPFHAFTILHEIQETLQKKWNKRVDLVDKSGLNEIGREFILPEVVYV